MYDQNVLEGYLIKGALMVRLIILIFIFVKMMTIKEKSLMYVFDFEGRIKNAPIWVIVCYYYYF